MTSDAPSRPDPVLAWFERRRPADTSGPPPAWLRTLVLSDDVELVAAEARATPALAVAWLAVMWTGDGLDALEEIAEYGAAVRAIDVLARVAPTNGAAVEAAADALVEALSWAEPDEPAYDAAVAALVHLCARSPAAREIVLAAHAAERDGTYEVDLYESVLAGTGTDDPRVRAVLLRRFERDPEHGAPLLALHSDPRFVPPLRSAFDRLPATPPADDPQRVRDGRAIGEALDDLVEDLDEASVARLHAYARAAEALEADAPADSHGRAALGAEVRALLDEADDAALRVEAPPSPLAGALDDALGLERVGDPAPPLERREGPGRNDPCWCGSGKKYKKCHLDADAAGG
jgi:hypothetical protein